MARIPTIVALTERRTAAIPVPSPGNPGEGMRKEAGLTLVF